MAVTINGTTGIVTPDLGVDGTTLVVDAANDRVGIGQSSPTKKLEVGGGAVSFSPDVAGKHTHEFTTNAANDARYFLRSDTTTKVDIQANGASYFNGGNVGIGTNNPAGTLHAHAPNSGLSNIRLSGTASGQVEYDIRQGIVGVNNAGFSIRDITNSATRFAITSDGNIGIGTDTFTATSSGRQIVEIEGASGSLINFAVGGARKAYHFTDGTDVYSYNTVSGSYIFGTNNTERLRITSSGQFNVGSGSFVVESDGDISTNVRCHGHIELDSTGGFSSPKIKLFSNTGSISASSVNLQSSATSSWFQTGTSIASYPYVWAAKNSSSNVWHSGLQTDGDLYLGGNLAGTNNIALNGSNGSGWFTGGLGIGGNVAANTIDDYEEGSFTATCANSVSLYSGNDTCQYVKIGSLVTVMGQVRVNSSNSNSNFVINNLPFAAMTAAEGSGLAAGSVRLYAHDMESTTKYVVCVAGSGTDLEFQAIRDNTSAVNISARTGAYYLFNVTYRTNA